MNRTLVSMALVAGLWAFGCQKKQDQTEAIRAGILKHLSAVSSLNVNSMDMDIKNVNIQGKEATALVEFRPKSGAPTGAGMQVSYSLEKQGGEWVVWITASAGGGINHPATGGNPHGQLQPGETQNQQNFPDLLHPGNPGASGALPPGHPPVSPGSSGPLPPGHPPVNPGQNPNSRTSDATSNSKQP